MFRVPVILTNFKMLNKSLLQKFSTKQLRPLQMNIKKDPHKITPLGWLLLLIPGTTFGLGCWQVKRKSWKENLISELNKKVVLSPISLPDNLDDLSSMEYRSVIVRGEFQHDKELYLGPRSLIRQDGVESKSGLISQRDDNIGYLIITPFKLHGREETILINRGWVPRNCLKPETRPNGQIPGETEMIGVVRLGEKRPQFLPHQKGNIFLYRDLDKMCSITGASPIFLDAKYESTVPGGPIGGQTRVTLRNDHLSYLITWFSLSGATMFMWYRQIFKYRP